MNREQSMTKRIKQSISNIALVVEDYDDAIAFYSKKLNVQLIEDTDLGGGKRWIQISPPNSNGTYILLAKVSNDEQSQSVFNQADEYFYFYKLQTTN
jgi:catechol 2,3-dioxygenase-like lactoylglutathione lyase family enzyme